MYYKKRRDEIDKDIINVTRMDCRKHPQLRLITIIIYKRDVDMIFICYVTIHKYMSYIYTCYVIIISEIQVYFRTKSGGCLLTISELALSSVCRFGTDAATLSYSL